MKELLNSTQAAAYLCLAKQTLARMRCEGTHSPAYYKVGRQVLYDRLDLDAWLEVRRHYATSIPAGQ